MKAAFWRQLDMLLQQRLPLMSALEILRKESREAKEQKFLSDVMARLTAGERFSHAACEGVSKGIVGAGEKAGDLSGAIHRLADRLESQERVRAQMISAALYPGFILILAVGLAFILGEVVLPRFEQLFRTLGVAEQLPALTQFLIASAAFLKSYGVWFWLAIGLGVGGVYWRAKGGKFRAWIWRWPVVGKIWRMMQREEFFNAMGILLQSGVTMDEALQLSALAVEGTPLERWSISAAERVRQGDKLSVVLRASGEFEEGQLQIVSIAEQSGGLGEALSHLAKVGAEAVQLRLKAILTLLEPILIVGMAAVVAVMVVALFLPLGPLVSRLSSGG